MAEKPLSLQDRFLNSLRRSKTPVTIFLVKGVKLQGVITWFDPFSLLLRRDGGAQLIYKHSVSTIMPAEAPAEFKADQAQLQAAQPGRTQLQDLFLAAAQRSDDNMTLFLINGVMLQGGIVAFDQFSLLLERSGQVQLVYKHAISTLQPPHPLSLGNEPEEAVDEGEGEG